MIALIVLGWLVWILSAGWAVVCLVVCVGEWRDYGLRYESIVPGLTLLFTAVALMATAVSSISKLHLIWIVPTILWAVVPSVLRIMARMTQ